MGLRSRTLTQILGYYGWYVEEVHYESEAGLPVEPIARFDLPPECRVVLRVARRWAMRCADCGKICDHNNGRVKTPRRWADLEMCGRTVVLEYAPWRVRCRCGSTGVEWLAWADKHQRQTQRLQQHLALESASMPLSHVAALHSLSWSTVRRAEGAALARWQATRQPTPLRDVGVDEKHLGRRGEREEDYLTIVSNNETGEPLWIHPGRSEEVLAKWLATLDKTQKSQLRLFVMDLFRGFYNAVKHDPDLSHVVIVHDPFHVMKQAVKMVDELRREVFFRAGPELRALGRGARWLVLRPWENCSAEEQVELRRLLRKNGKLARAYQIMEELREALDAPTRHDMGLALTHLELRTQRKDNKPVHRLHNMLKKHAPELLAQAEYRPATGRVEALNNNWETLVRRGRGYRDLGYLHLKLRFMIANPVRTTIGTRRFLALGLPQPLRSAA
jgi:transposase